MLRPAAFLAAFALVITLVSSFTVTAASAATEGACAVVKKNTAKKFKKRTQVVKKTRKKFKAAKKKLKAAKRNGASKAVRAKLTKQVKQTRKKFTAAKKKRKAVVRKRKQVCAPGMRLITVSPKGKPGNGESEMAAVSANDRFVVFVSEASNLVAGDTNRSRDVFVRDRVKGKTTRVSVQNNGKQLKWGGTNPAISADGRYVAFASNSPELGVPSPANIDQQPAGIFVRDRKLGTTTRATYAADGKSHLNHWPGGITISDDGRYLAYDSFATNVVAGTQSEMTSVYVTDRAAKKNYRASVSPTGAVANSWAKEARISGNGRFVVYSTDASNYGFAADRNVPFDYKVFAWDRTTLRSRIVSVNPDGTLMGRSVGNPSVSTDGQHVLFDKRKVISLTPTSSSSVPESLQFYDRLASAGSYTRAIATGTVHSGFLSPDATWAAHRTTTGLGVIRNIKTGKQVPVTGLKGQPADGWIRGYTLSNGGRVLAFTSDSTNLVKKKTPDEVDQVYVRIR